MAGGAVQRRGRFQESMANWSATATDRTAGQVPTRRCVALTTVPAGIEGSWAARHWNATLVGLGTALLVLNVLPLYPGFMSFDSVMQLGQALDPSTLTDWHPPVMTALWWVLIELSGQRIGSMLIAQLGLLWASLTLLAVYVFQESGRRRLSLLPLALGVLPHVASMSGVIWKDGQLAFAMLGAVVLLLFVRRGISHGRLRWLAVGAVVLLLVYAGAVRYNALPAIIPLLFLLTWPGAARRSRVLTAAAAVLGALVATPVIDSVRPVQATHPAASIMLDDVLHLYSASELAGSDVSPPLRDYLVALATACPPATRDVNYTWRCANTTGTIPSVFLTHSDELRGLYLGGIAEHPVGYAGFRLGVFADFLVTPPEDVFVSWYTIADNPYGLTFEPNRAVTALQAYVGVTTRSAGLVFMPWAWLLVAVAVLVVGLRGRASSRHAGVVLALGASAALYVVTYLPMVIGYDYRYVYWSAIAVSVAAVLVLLDRRTVDVPADLLPTAPSAPARAAPAGSTP